MQEMHVEVRCEIPCNSVVPHIFVWGSCFWILLQILASYVKGEDLGYSTECQPGVVLYKKEELGPPFCICIHFVVDSFQILICIL